MAAKFELYKDGAGKFRFRLKAGNGEIIAVGEAYESKPAALNGIESVKRNAPVAEISDLSEGADGAKKDAAKKDAVRKPAAKKAAPAKAATPATMGATSVPPSAPPAPGPMSPMN
jgi:uncharacterized protein YegP (UPF0339 family)